MLYSIERYQKFGCSSRGALLENITAFAADIEQFLSPWLALPFTVPHSLKLAGRSYHAGLNATLLRLEEDSFFVLAGGTRLVGPGELDDGTRQHQHQRTTKNTQNCSQAGC